MPADLSYPDSEIARLIRSSRIRQGLSQARLGAALDRTATTVRRWERGEAAPDEDLLPALAEVLHVDPALLVHALRGPDPQLIVSAPTPTQAGPVATAAAEFADTSVSGGEAATSLDVPDAPADVPKIEARPLRPGIALVPTPPREHPPTDDGEGPAGEAESSQDVSEPVVPPQWIEVDRDRMPAPVASEEPAVPLQPLSKITSPDQATQKVQIPVAPPPPPTPAVVPAVGWRQLPSYLEDPREKWRYILRGILTAVILLVMAYVALWASGELLSALDAALDLFSDADEAPASGLIVP